MTTGPLLIALTCWLVHWQLSPVPRSHLTCMKGAGSQLFPVWRCWPQGWMSEVPGAGSPTGFVGALPQQGRWAVDLLCSLDQAFVAASWLVMLLLAFCFMVAVAWVVWDLFSACNELLFCWGESYFEWKMAFQSAKLQTDNFPSLILIFERVCCGIWCFFGIAPGVLVFVSWGHQVGFLEATLGIHPMAALLHRHLFGFLLHV